MSSTFCLLSNLLITAFSVRAGWGGGMMSVWVVYISCWVQSLMFTDLWEGIFPGFVLFQTDAGFI